jgi:hypothetical protein
MTHKIQIPDPKKPQENLEEDSHFPMQTDGVIYPDQFSEEEDNA